MDPKRLLDWYRDAHRRLPWRDTKDPYAIWVSEVMLQQTRVETVIPYWHRFMARFPDVHALAAAPLDEVLKAWEGLGYYARCRNLHKAAAVVAGRHGGRFPEDPAAAAALPGLGRSSVGAVLSIAYGAVLPVLDGNVRRVAVRILDEREDPRRPVVQRRLWQAVTSWIAASPDPGTHNQALMELGATVCLPRGPRCEACPVADGCAAREAGTADRLPARGPARTVPEVEAAVGILRDKTGRIFVQRRPPDGLLGGLWEFPGGKIRPGESPAGACAREVLEETGFPVRVGDPVAVVRHAYSHFRVVLHAFECRGADGTPTLRGADAWAWVAPADLSRYAFPGANRKILQAMRGTDGGPNAAGQRRRKIIAKPASRPDSAQQPQANRSPKRR